MRSATPINRKKELTAVLLLACAVLLAFAFYLPSSRTGWLGSLLLNGSRGLFGVAAYALPILFLYMTLDYFLGRRLPVTRMRMVCATLLMLFAGALLHQSSISMDQIRELSRDAAGEPRAFAALEKLWQTGIDPTLISTSGIVLPGGLICGMLALGLTALAGPSGGIVLSSALSLAMIVLIFNISLTGAIGRTAQLLGEKRRQAGERIRSGRQEHRTDPAAIGSGAVEPALSTAPPDPSSYDLKVDPAAHASGSSFDINLSAGADKPDAPYHKPTLLESLKKLFMPHDEWADGPRSLASQDLPVPDFLRADAVGKEATRSADSTVPPTAGSDSDPSGGSLVQRAPFDLQLSGAAQLQRAGSDPSGTSSAETTSPTEPRYPSGSDPTHEGGRAHWPDGKAPENGVRRRKENDQIAIDIPYQYPPLTLLREDRNLAVRQNDRAVRELGAKLEKTLDSFGVSAKVVRSTTGPTITRFELSPGLGVKVSRIVSLADDIALNLAALGVRIEAPIPGKSAIGIEIPNKETSPVLLRGLLELPEYANANSPLTAALGRDIAGNPIFCDITRMPHLLIAGATGSGKSVCINSILISILYRSSPQQVRMLMIDTKVVELSAYNGIPHLYAPVVTDPKKAANALNWAVKEMGRRYDLFAAKSVRDISSYQEAARADEKGFENLPLILFVIDELSDLMATAPNEVEEAIARLTAMARAAGIHLIIATQRPSVDVITGVIKANIPSRIAFSVASQVDSRTILDIGGAEKLLGKGDMLYYPQSFAKPVRGQAAFVTDSEVERVLTFIKNHHVTKYDSAIHEQIMTATTNNGKTQDTSEQDELLPQALGIVIEFGYASVSLLQRRMNIGYPRAARLIDRMNEAGYIGPFEGSKPRKVLMTKAQYMEFMSKLNGESSKV